MDFKLGDEVVLTVTSAPIKRETFFESFMIVVPDVIRKFVFGLIVFSALRITGIL